jgi:hypothetical protein
MSSSSSLSSFREEVYHQHHESAKEDEDEDEDEDGI